MLSDPIVPVVIDTNIMVPSVYRVTPILKYILLGNLVPVWNHFVFTEAFRIAYDMWDNHYSKRMDISQLDDTISLLETVFKLGYSVPEMPENWVPVSIDRKDDPFLWVAMTGKAEYIITRDRKHLLRLRAFNGIPIGRPGEFFGWATKTHPLE